MLEIGNKVSSNKSVKDRQSKALTYNKLWLGIKERSEGD
jgi:hypothetical protein